MSYLVTGGTGFIGRHLLPHLSARGAPVYVLVRPGSRERLDRIRLDAGPGGAAIQPVEGDLTAEALGLAEADRRRLGGVQHVFHLAARYDLSNASAAGEFERANVEGTHQALALARELQAGCFHFVSTIAVAGRFRGSFSEDMFEQAEGLDHPYFRSKHAAEGLVRGSGLRWRIYRPGMVVGHSATGAMDKVDGPYYLFKLIQKLRSLLPPWTPLIGFEGGHINLVPVDFVAAALAHLAHLPSQDGRCFHLTDPQDRRIGAVLNLFAAAAHAPSMAVRLEPQLLAALPRLVRAASEALVPVQHLIDEALGGLGIPRPIVGLLNYPTRFDAARAQSLLAPAGIQVPRLEDYAWRLWDYWERQLDPALFKSRNLGTAVRNKTVLITGGSSGIGRATAIRLAAAGARVLIVARDPGRLAAVQSEIEAQGGRAVTYACDIAEPADCQRFLAELLRDGEPVDILINNAGRSIRRAIENSYQRLHDYERLMKINYLAAVAVTLGVLPGMVRQGAGHVISISSIGVLSNAPRFAGYNASKAALEAFSRAAAGEYRAHGVRFTVINMPLVRTPMVAPTRIYAQFPMMEPQEAAELVLEAVIRKPERLATGLGTLAALVELLAPHLQRALMGESFRMFPESQAAGGTSSTDEASPQMIAFASLLRGIHW